MKLGIARFVLLSSLALCVSAHFRGLLQAGDGSGSDESNSICNATDARPGGYRPVAPATVPEELPLAVFEAFLATNATYNGEAYTGCDDFGTAVVEACEQVVAGTNYKVNVAVACVNSSWSNGVETVFLQATVFEPLPNTNRPLEVQQVEFAGVIANTVPPEDAMCPGPKAPGGWVGITPAELPRAVAEAANVELDNLLVNSTCVTQEVSERQVCTQVVSGGTNYNLQLNIACPSGDVEGFKAVHTDMTFFLPATPPGRPVLRDSSVVPLDQ